jgi:hypothetical protein
MQSKSTNSNEKNSLMYMHAIYISYDNEKIEFLPPILQPGNTPRHLAPDVRVMRMNCFEQVASGYVRFQVFTAVTMKNVIFWDVTPRDSCNNRSFEGT